MSSAECLALGDVSGRRGVPMRSGRSRPSELPLLEVDANHECNATEYSASPGERAPAARQLDAGRGRIKGARSVTRWKPWLVV